MTITEFAMARHARIMADRINSGEILDDHDKDVYRGLMLQVRILAAREREPIDPSLLEPLWRAEAAINVRSAGAAAG